MRIMIFYMLIMVVVPLALISWQYNLCKKNSKHTLVLPKIAAVLTIFFGFYFLVIALILFYMHYEKQKEKKEKVSEIRKMNIEDL